MVGWHHQLDGHESEQIPGDGEGQGGLACCDSWGFKESDILLVIHGDKCKKQSHAGSAASDPYLKTVSSAYLCSYKGLTCVRKIFWSGDRLTFYGPTFLSVDKG